MSMEFPKKLNIGPQVSFTAEDEKKYRKRAENLGLTGKAVDAYIQKERERIVGAGARIETNAIAQEYLDKLTGKNNQENRP